jgi:hypothetical protein
MVRLEGLDKLEKFNDLIGTRTRDLPACSISLQPRAHKIVSGLNKLGTISLRRLLE